MRWGLEREGRLGSGDSDGEPNTRAPRETPGGVHDNAITSPPLPAGAGTPVDGEDYNRPAAGAGSNFAFKFARQKARQGLCSWPATAVAAVRRRQKRSDIDERQTQGQEQWQGQWVLLASSPLAYGTANTTASAAVSGIISSPLSLPTSTIRTNATATSAPPPTRTTSPPPSSSAPSATFHVSG